MATVASHPFLADHAFTPVKLVVLSWRGKSFPFAFAFPFLAFSFSFSFLSFSFSFAAKSTAATSASLSFVLALALSFPLALALAFAFSATAPTAATPFAEWGSVGTVIVVAVVAEFAMSSGEVRTRRSLGHAFAFSTASPFAFLFGSGRLGPAFGAPTLPAWCGRAGVAKDGTHSFHHVFVDVIAVLSRNVVLHNLVEVFVAAVWVPELFIKPFVVGDVLLERRVVLDLVKVDLLELAFAQVEL